MAFNIFKSESSKNLRWHLLVALVLFAISIIFFYKIISNKNVIDNVHHINNLAFLSYNIKDGIFNQGTFPLWTPYFFSGIPLIAIPEHYIFDLNLILILLFKDIYLAMNLSIILYFFAAGLGMYFLVFTILGNKKSAFISALIYMLNGFMHSFLIPAHINLLESYAIIPFVILFTIKAIRGKNSLAYSILAGIFFSMQILMGGVIFFFYTAVLFGLLLFLHFILDPKLKNIKKLVLIGLIVLIVTLGLSAVKLLPTMEFVKQSSRGSAVNYKEYLGYPISLKNSFNLFVSNIGFNDVSGSIGVAGLILLIFGFASFKKRYFIFSLILIILAILLAVGSPIAKLFFDYMPGFSQMRHIERALVLFEIGASIIIGYGSLNLFSKLERKNLGIYVNVIFMVIVIGVLAELMMLQHKSAIAKVIEPKDIELLEFMSKDSDRFRTMNLGLKELVGTSGYVYYIQKGIEDAKGGGGIWTDDYINYLAVADQLNPTRLWGLINVKYVVSDRQIESPQLEFAGKFNECKECAVWQAFGPYLYRNKDYVEKTYITDTGVLVVGDGKAARDMVYILLARNTNPGNSVIIQGSSINDYSADDLKKFKAVILARNSIDEGSSALLKSYSNSGGLVLPDIANGKSTIGEADLANLFKKINGSHNHVDISLFSYNKLIADISNKKGFLVLGERYSFFPGWSARLNGIKVPILKANNFISSVYIDGNYEKIAFEYNSRSFYIGLYITLMILLLIIAYFLFLMMRKFKTKKSNSTI